MSSREEIEQAIRDEEAILDEVVGLLESGTDVALWRAELRAALALALADGAMPRPEQWKAVTLRRHLFGPEDQLPVQLVADEASTASSGRYAERLRADLAACVRYRAGAYLLRPSR